MIVNVIKKKNSSFVSSSLQGSKGVLLFDISYGFETYCLYLALIPRKLFYFKYTQIVEKNSSSVFTVFIYSSVVILETDWTWVTYL